eukprot:m.69106 g.69106  ORF g.69106 m.69106 type:complete len:50 (+) comp16015_c1_seq7:5278-5427(+)
MSKTTTITTVVTATPLPATAALTCRWQQTEWRSREKGVEGTPDVLREDP